MRINELLNASTRPSAPASEDQDDADADADWDMDGVKPDPAAAAGPRRMDMASLMRPQASIPPVSAPAEEPNAWARPRPDLSMSRIIKELETGRMRPAAIHSVQPVPPSVAAATVLKVATTTAPAAASTAAQPANQTADVPGPRRPRRRPGPAADADKRVKQRLLVKRSYYRKLDTLSELRAEVETLERDLQHVLRAAPPSPLSTETAPVPSATPADPTDALRSRFARLAVAQDALRRENERLRAVAMDQSKMSTRVRILLAEEQRDLQTARSALSRVHRSPLPSVPSSPPTSPRSPPSAIPSPPSATNTATGVRVAGLTVRTLTTADCTAVTSAAVTAVRAFHSSETRTESTGASVFGWRDRRRVDADGRTLRFSLEKTFHGLPARELARRMWGLVSSAAGLSRVYASARGASFQLLQRVDERHSLFYREMCVPGGRPVRSLVLAALVDVGGAGDEPQADSFLVLVRSMDPRTLVVGREEDGEDETWADVFSWGVYEAAGSRGEHCRNAFGGFVRTSPEPEPRTELKPGVVRADVAFWLLLVLVIAVRCESEVVGAPVLLPSEEDEAI